MKKVLITGYNGLLGKDLIKKLGNDFSIVGLGRSDFEGMYCTLYSIITRCRISGSTNQNM